jgi:hypothetical protein
MRDYILLAVIAVSSAYAAWALRRIESAIHRLRESLAAQRGPQTRIERATGQIGTQPRDERGRDETKRSVAENAPVPDASVLAPAYSDELQRTDSADQNPQVDASRPSTDDAFSIEGAHSLYKQWCETHQQPESGTFTEITSVGYYRSAESRSVAQKLVHDFRDVEGTDDFIRISPRGGTAGLLFPHPTVLFNEGAHKVVFPQTDGQIFADSQRRATIRGIPVKRMADQTWETT